jgi:hypothetical protein
VKEDAVKRAPACIALFLALIMLAGSSNAQSEKYGAPLKYLSHMRTSALAEKAMGTAARAVAQSDDVMLTVKFDHILSDAEVESLEGRGAIFSYIDGRVARTRTIYPVRVPWSLLDELGGRSEVLRLESAWKPAVYPLLDVSAHEVQADSAWHHHDHMGLPITGKGLRVSDFDTGVDVFHPSFFFADGDTFNWIDVDGFGSFDPGFDAVDLNRNGSADPGEVLRYWDGWINDYASVWGGGNPNNAGNGYQTYWDWLYNDANDNSTRDFGPAAGYTESDPTYGEQVFIAIDTNDNGALNAGEKLVALKTSKIYATMGDGAVEFTRGVDLINSTPDANGHGSSVAGILAGGTVDRHIFTGIAPEAEILTGYFFSGNPISALIPWARARGSQCMLYEFGGFIGDYLDGSSLDEEAITAMNDTVIQVTPSGNLGRGHKHSVATVAALDSIMLQITVPDVGTAITEWWNTTLWRTALADLTFRIKTPRGVERTLSSIDTYVDGFYIYMDKSQGPRGTDMLYLYIDHYTNPNCLGTWQLKVVSKKSSSIDFISNVADNYSSWAGGTEFLNYYSDQNNVTWPATADGAFVNGSYSTRGFEGYGGVGGGSIPVGEISAFSGRGPRIDGKHLLDICSPGNYDVYTTRSHQDGSGYPNGSYRQFSGTSAAGPHVAAAAILVQQAWPSATMEDVAYLLTSHAATDGFTGSVYNDTWGWGKLRILEAIGVASGVEDMATGSKPPRLLLDQNYPNPFNPTTWIPFFLPSDGLASVKVYNVNGELVRVLKDRWLEKGAHSVRWNGDDARGRSVASGVYFCELTFAGETQTRKLVLVR